MEELFKNPAIYAIICIIIAAASEIIALTPLKSNSIIQLIFNVLKKIFKKN